MGETDGLSRKYGDENENEMNGCRREIIERID